jgi:predicted AAA+ superfamily ATPase
MKDTFDLQNPWRSPGYTFTDEPYIKRSIFSTLIEDLHKKKITVLLGARQVGKTFLIKKMIEKLLADKEIDPKQIFYFNFDAFSLIDLVENDRDFFSFIKSYGVTDKQTYIFLDEAQRIPEAGLLIKRYYDLGHDIKFIVSGSSSLQIKGQTKETLTGRKTLFELYPVSYYEFLKFKGVEPPDGPAQALKFEAGGYQRLMEEFVRFGGYPGVVVADSFKDKIILLKEIYTSYIQKDISDFLKVEDVSGFNRMVQFISAQTASLCKINEVAKNVHLSRHFVEKYLLALEETYVIAFLRPYFANLGKAIIKTPKVYFYDTGLRNAVFGEFQPLDNRADIGTMIENFVFSELIKSVEKDRLWFYRTTTGSEIDFIFIKGNKTIPIEVKYRISGQKAYPKTFNTLAKHTNFKKGLVITKNYLQEKKTLDMQILYIPASVLYCTGAKLD